MAYTMDLLEKIYEKCLSKPEEEREAFILQECHGDEVLKQMALRMVQNKDNAIKYFQELQQTIVTGMLNENIPTLEAAEIVGSYRVLRLLGKGGMSNVYLAERMDGQFEQQVTIKCFSKNNLEDKNLLVKRGEQQILAKLQHPNIANLLDAGVTSKGVPYFIMDYIEGIPIDAYVQQKKCSLSEILNLFIQVANTVMYAHSRMILHLDLKPSNILVNQYGQIKLLDFGIAITITSSQNNQNEFLGTPSFAAPEQLMGEPLSTSTDVYQMGILLHKLITNDLPIISTQNNSNDLTIRKLSEIVTEKKIAEHIEFELKAVIKRCIETNPYDRYPAIQELAKDVQNYLFNYPVTAVKLGSNYHLKKYIKRNKTKLIGVLLITISLLAGTTISLFQANRANQQRDLAVKNEQIAGATKDFIIEMFMSANPSNAKGDTMTVYQFLDEGYKKAESYNGSSEIKLEMLTTIGRLYRSLGNYNKSKSVLEKAYRLAKDSVIEVSTTYIRAIEQLGLYQRDIGHYDSAQILLNNVLKMYSDINYPKLDSFYTASLKYLSYVYKKQEHLDSATLLIQNAINLEEQLWPDHNNLNLAESYFVLAGIYKEQFKYELAIENLTKSLSICENLMGTYYPGTLANMNTLSSTLVLAGRYEEALIYSLKAKQIALRLFGNNHLETSTIMDNLADRYLKLKNYDSAHYYFDYSLKIRNKAFPNINNVHKILSYNNFLSLFSETNQQDSLKKYLNKAISIDKSVKIHSRQWAATYRWAGEYYELKAKTDSSRYYYNKSLAESLSYLPENHERVVFIKKKLAHTDSLIIAKM